jgi:hypothetical protein
MPAVLGLPLPRHGLFCEVEEWPGDLRVSLYKVSIVSSES